MSTVSETQTAKPFHPTSSAPANHSHLPPATSPNAVTSFPPNMQMFKNGTAEELTADSPNTPWTRSIPDAAAVPPADYNSAGSEPVSAAVSRFRERWETPAEYAIVPELHSISHRLAPVRDKPLLNREKSLHLPPIAMNVPVLAWGPQVPALERRPMLAPHTPLSPHSQYRPAKSNAVSAPVTAPSLGTNHVSPAPSPQTIKQEPEFRSGLEISHETPRPDDSSADPVAALDTPTSAPAQAPVTVPVPAPVPAQAPAVAQDQPQAPAAAPTPVSAPAPAPAPVEATPAEAQPVSAPADPRIASLMPAEYPPLANHAYMAALAHTFPGGFPPSAFPPNAYGALGFLPNGYPPGYPPGFPMSPMYASMNPGWFGQGYPMYSPVPGLTLPPPTSTGPLNVSPPAGSAVPPHLYANGVPMYMYPPAPVSMNQLGNPPVTPTDPLPPSPVVQQNGLPNSLPANSHLSNPSPSALSPAPPRAPSPTLHAPASPNARAENKQNARHPKKTSLPLIDSLSPVITTAEEFARRMRQPKPAPTRGPRTRDEAVRMFQEYRRRKGYAAGDAALPPTDEPERSEKPRIALEEGGESRRSSATNNTASGAAEIDANSSSMPAQSVQSAASDPAASPRKPVRELWPPGMLPPPGVMPAGEMPPPPPAFTNPTRILSAREIKENEESELYDKHDREAYRRRRNSYIPYSAVKSPKLPRSKRYWLDQQAALVANLESRGFVAIYKETEDYSRFFCSLCNKDFETKLLCIRHAVEHLNFKPFRCTDCDMEFTRCDTLQRHLKGRCLGPESQVVLQREAAIMERAAGRETEFVLQRAGPKRRPRVDKTLAAPESDDDTDELGGTSVSSEPLRETFEDRPSLPEPSVTDPSPAPAPVSTPAPLPAPAPAVVDTPPSQKLATTTSPAPTAPAVTEQLRNLEPAVESLKRVAGPESPVSPKRRSRAMEETDSSSDDEDASSSRILTGSKFLRPGPAPVVMPARRK